MRRGGVRGVEGMRIIIIIKCPGRVGGERRWSG